MVFYECEDQVVNRSNILEKLRALLPEMRKDFGVDTLSLFGSASTDSLRPDSDIDILVSFAGGVTFDRYFGLKKLIEDTLGRSVDLATPNMIKPRMQQHIEAQLLRVA